MCYTCESVSSAMACLSANSGKLLEEEQERERRNAMKTGGTGRGEGEEEEWEEEQQGKEGRKDDEERTNKS